MKHYLTLLILLALTWLLWSGHFESAFLLVMGVASCCFCLWMAARMRIVDEEGAPVQLGIRPFVFYLPWLLKEVMVANLEVAKIIMSSKLSLKRNMIVVPANQHSELGKVILANSITLTPGTVSVNVRDDSIVVHALSFEGAPEDLSGEMDRRVCQLERGRDA